METLIRARDNNMKSILAHDPTPRDVGPQGASVIVRKDIFRPEETSPRRHGLQAFHAYDMVDKTLIVPSLDPRREEYKAGAGTGGRRFGHKNSTDTKDPGISASEPSEFYFGTHSTRTVEGTTYGYKGPDKLIDKLPVDLRTSITRKLEKQREVQQDLIRFKETDEHHKLQVHEQRQSEKQQELDLLRKYDPWGKPGAGAPVRPLDGRRRPHASSAPASDSFHGSFGRPGGGAPNRSSSGKVMAQYIIDPEVMGGTSEEPARVPQKHIDPTKASEYRSELDRHVNMRQSLEKVDPREELAFADTIRTTEPKARIPHATDAHERRRNADEKYLENLERQIQEHKQQEVDFKLSQAEPEEFLWGKSAISRDENGRVMRHRRPERTKEELEKDILKGLGNNVRSEHREVEEDFPTKFLEKRPHRRRQPSHDDTLPWGRPGAGAPLYDESGNIITNPRRTTESGEGTHGTSQRARKEMMQRLEHDIAYKREQQHQEKNRDLGEERKMIKDGMLKLGAGAGYAKKTASGTLFPYQGRPTTDVINNQRSIPPEQQGVYHKELDSLVEQRKSRRQQDRKDTYAQELEHVTTVDEGRNWGRPGAGAPIRDDEGHVKAHIQGAARDLHEVAGIAPRKIDPKEAAKYHHELDTMRGARDTQRIRARELERNLSQQHVANYGRAFGRPGHGAPLIHHGHIETVPMKVAPDIIELRKNAIIVGGAASVRAIDK
eukprot:Opistho-2@90999